MSLLSSIIYFTWFLSEVLLNRLLRSKKTDQQNEDKGSLTLIWIVIFVSIFSAVFMAKSISLPIMDSTVIIYIGLSLIIIGIVLRIMIIRTLGQFFTVDVTIKQDHKLKKDGFYTYIRHPSYTASLITVVGFGISLNNYASLVLVTVLISIAFLIRIKVEEKLLTAHFGAEYLEYQKNTKALIPFIY